MKQATKQAYPLTPETRSFLERLIQERDASIQRLDVALLAIKAALGVPLAWQIQSLDEGFTPGADNRNGATNGAGEEVRANGADH